MDSQKASEMSKLDELVAARRQATETQRAQQAAQDEAKRQEREKRAAEGVRRWIAERPSFAAACGFVPDMAVPAQLAARAEKSETRVLVRVRSRALLDGGEVETYFEVAMNGDTGQWWQRSARLVFTRGDDDAQTQVEDSSDDGNALLRAGGLADTLLERIARGKENRERAAAEQAAALERGRRGATVVKQVAQEYLDICRSHDAAVMAWAHEWAAQWQPWSGWQVRYAPVGAPAGEENVMTVLVLDELNDVIAESPGASVRAVEWDGTVREMVIGAFLDATPVEFEAHDLRRGLEYHRQVRTYLLDGPDYGEPMVVNVPPGAKWSPPAPPVKPLDWGEYIEQRTGLEHSGLPDPAQLLARDDESLAAQWNVQGFADVEL